MPVTTPSKPTTPSAKSEKAGKSPDKPKKKSKKSKSKKAAPDATLTDKKKKKKSSPKATATHKAPIKAERESGRVRGIPESGLPLRQSTAPLAVDHAGFSPREALVLPQLPQPTRGERIDLGVVAGTGGPTRMIGAGATDLCEIAPSGLVAVAGDTFSGGACRDGDWSPSLALRVKPNSLRGKVEFDRSFGWGNLYADGWPQGGYPAGGSQLPAGTVQVFGIDYLLVTRTKDDLEPIDSRLVRIDPERPGWPTLPDSLRNADWEDGNQTQISGCQAPDGFVYIVADGFARNTTVRLYRCPASTFADRNSWHAWGMVDGDRNRWAWDQRPTPLSNDKFGELSLRMIEGKFVFSGFNQSTGCVEVRVADRVEAVLAPWTPCTVVVDQMALRRNYGGYIVPGSTLDQARILVSQWEECGCPYNVREYVVNLNR
jgi:hypothetical protein